ncbi:hypothetical protein U0070_008910, partial [Myodes glareolus]
MGNSLHIPLRPHKSSLSREHQYPRPVFCGRGFREACPAALPERFLRIRQSGMSTCGLEPLGSRHRGLMGSLQPICINSRKTKQSCSSMGTWDLGAQMTFNLGTLLSPELPLDVVQRQSHEAPSTRSDKSRGQEEHSKCLLSETYMLGFLLDLDSILQISLLSLLTENSIDPESVSSGSSITLFLSKKAISKAGGSGTISLSHHTGSLELGRLEHFCFQALPYTVVTQAKSYPVAIPIGNQEKPDNRLILFWNPKPKSQSLKRQSKIQNSDDEAGMAKSAGGKAPRVEGYDSVGHGWTQQHVGEALCGVGWSASQPEDLRENRKGENKTHTLKTEQKSSLGDPEPQNLHLDLQEEPPGSASEKQVFFSQLKLGQLGLKAVPLRETAHQEGTMTLWRGRLWALQLVDKGGWGCEAFLLLSACMKDFDLGARHGSCCLGSMRRPWQTMDCPSARACSARKLRGDCRALVGGGAEEPGFAKFRFSSVHKTPATFSVGVLEGTGSVNSELLAALLFNTASSLDTASTEEAGFWAKSSSSESSRITALQFDLHHLAQKLPEKQREIRNFPPPQMLFHSCHCVLSATHETSRKAQSYCVSPYLSQLLNALFQGCWQAFREGRGLPEFLIQSHSKGITSIIHILERASFWRLTEQLLQVQVCQGVHGSGSLEQVIIRSGAKEKRISKKASVLSVHSVIMPPSSWQRELIFARPKLEYEYRLATRCHIMPNFILVKSCCLSPSFGKLGLFRFLLLIIGVILFLLLYLFTTFFQFPLLKIKDKICSNSGSTGMYLVSRMKAFHLPSDVLHQLWVEELWAAFVIWFKEGECNPNSSCSWLTVLMLFCSSNLLFPGLLQKCRIQRTWERGELDPVGLRHGYQQVLA